MYVDAAYFKIHIIKHQAVNKDLFHRFLVNWQSSNKFFSIHMQYFSSATPPSKKDFAKKIPPLHTACTCTLYVHKLYLLLVRQRNVCLIPYLLSLSCAVGPTIPPTINEEWEEGTRQKLIRQKANPIEGISSRSS